MCSRSDVERARGAQDRAADALASLCVKGLCTDDIAVALHELYDGTAKEEVPAKFAELLGRLS
jgi:hypothetical protein